MLRHIAPNCLAPLCVLATSMFGWALLGTLAQGLGEAFTPEVRAAWVTLYGVISDTMQAAAQAPTLAVA